MRPRSPRSPRSPRYDLDHLDDLDDLDHLDDTDAAKWSENCPYTGGPGEVLGGLVAILRRHLEQSSFDRFFGRFWSPKGCPKGGILGAKMAPKSIPKRGRNLRRKKSPLGTNLGRFWFVLGGARGAFLLIFYWFLYYFVEINVFDVKTVPRRFGDEIWPKMTSTWAPKTSPNRSKIETEN